MRVDSTFLTSNIYGGIQKTIQTTSVATDVFQQTLRLDADKLIDLGTMNGKPFNMKIFQDGGQEWSGALSVKYHEGREVTAEDAAVAYAAQSYTSTEWEQGDQISAVIGCVNRMISRQENSSSFNDYIKSASIPIEAVEDALYRLGFDPNEPFTINDRTFVWDSNELIDYEEVK